MTKQPLFVLLALTVVSAVSCKHADRTGVLVPKDAAFVLHINSSSLSSKISWDEIRQNDWFNSESNDANDSLARALMQNPESSGIDTKGDITFFVKKQNRGGYTALEGSVKDAAAFESFTKKISKTTATTTKKDDLNVLALKNKAVAIWDKTRFIYVMDAPGINNSNALMKKDEEYTEPYSFPVDSLQKFGLDVLAISGSDNLGSDDRFADLMKEKGDMHFWMNSEQYYNGMADGMMSMMKIDVLFENSALAATLDFDKGAINAKVSQYASKELRELWNKYPPRDISDATLKRIPADNMAGAIVFTYPPPGFKELLKLIGVDGIVNGFLGKNGVTLDDVVKATKGDVIFAVTNFAVKTDTMAMAPEVTHKEPSANVLFATSVNDRASFDKLVGAVKSQMPEELPDQAKKFSYQLNNEWFAAGNSSGQISKFLAGGANNNILASKIGGHPFGMYVDIHQMLSSAGTFMQEDSLSKAGVDASLKMWQDLVITGGEKKGDAFVSKATVNLVDKNTNSLKQLNQYIGEMKRINKEKESKYRRAF